MNLLQAAVRSVTRPLYRDALMPWDGGNAWSSLFDPDGLGTMLHTTMQPDRERDITGEFVSLAANAYRGNGVAFACMLTRYMLFSQARFQFQQMRKGLPGPLFGTPELAVLDHPEPSKSSVDLLSQALLDADLDGNWFGVRRPGRIKRLRPDWTTIIVGSPNSDLGSWDPDAEVIGYGYEPGGPGHGKPMFFLRDEVAHFAPIKDPEFQYRGMSWLHPILRELMGDSSASAHKLAFFRNAATPNVAISLPSTMTLEKAREWIALFEQEHKGIANAYKSMYFGGGAEANVIGLDFQKMDFSRLQAGYETRIAAASGMHPVIVPFSEGLTGSSLNAGNFQQAARLVADKTLHPLWSSFSGSLETIIPVPNSAARVWYSPDIPFLRTDVKDAAEIQHTYATTINALIDTGFEPASAIDAVTSSDMNRLIHTGLLSVQLQPPGAQVAARGEFWAADGPLAGLGTVERGMILPADHPIARAFPSMFDAVDVPLLMAGEVRCSGCGNLLGEKVTPPYQFTCRRCKVVTEERGSVPTPWVTRDLVPFRKRTEAPLPAPAPVIETHVHFDAGSIAITTPVNVEPSRMEAGAIVFNAGDVDARTMPGAVTTTVEAGDAPQVTVNVPERTVEAPQVTVNVPERTIEAPQVTINVPERTMEAPQVTLNIPPPPERRLIRTVLELDARDKPIGQHEEFVGD